MISLLYSILFFLLFSSLSIFLLIIYTKRKEENCYFWKPKKYNNIFDFKTHGKVIKELIKNKLGQKTNKNYLIIGTGSLGTSIVKLLLLRGEKNIKTLDIQPNLPNELSKEKYKDKIQHFKGDMSDIHSIETFFKNIDVVYLNAAIIQFWAIFDFEWDINYLINVKGVENVINLCKKNNVKILIFTSTPHVTFDVDKMSFNSFNPTKINSSTPVTINPINHYVKTKIMAEKLVNESNSKNFKTLIIRPYTFIYGHYDQFRIKIFFDQILKNNYAFTFPFEGIYDVIFVEDVAIAHILGEKALFKNRCYGGEIISISGKSCNNEVTFNKALQYFSIENGFVNCKLFFLPMFISYILSFISYFLTLFSNGKLDLGVLKYIKPPMLFLSSASFILYDDKAKKILHYEPFYNFEEGIYKTVKKYIKYCIVKKN